MSIEYDWSIDEPWRVREREAYVDLYKRTFQYALRIIRLYRYLKEKRDGVSDVIGRQLLRAGTSVGANVAESRSAASRSDYAHKLNVALKEAQESRYWLELLVESEYISRQMAESLMDETRQLIAIMTATVIKLRKPR